MYLKHLLGCILSKNGFRINIYLSEDYSNSSFVTRGDVRLTSVIEMTTKELARKIEAIKALGFVRSARKGPTGIGHTFEGLMGYSENNISVPDWGVVELKTTRKNSDNLITLFSKVPKRRKGLTPKLLVEKYGYWDERKQRQALYTSINGTKPNSLGWILKIDEKENTLKIFHNGTEVAYQPLKELESIIDRKVNNLALVLADTKTKGKDEFFHYNEAWLLANPESENLIGLIRGGYLIFDWRMHIKSTGRARDHGPGYRIKESSLPKLYSEKVKLV
ncbi:MAG: hypothetical protein GF411_13380 [Candidatus Lokiarchaeota archaeon]|nr:hypothetical protein [Candidatus Lokiarchaeota archaeon]